jgi:tetratricopeptide (TPR) repeat protein
MGRYLEARAQFVEAKPYYERALAIREQVLGPDHPDTAHSLNNLGYLLQAQGDLAGAKPYYERALQIFRLRWVKTTNIRKLYWRIWKPWKRMSNGV